MVTTLYKTLEPIVESVMTIHNSNPNIKWFVTDGNVYTISYLLTPKENGSFEVMCEENVRDMSVKFPKFISEKKGGKHDYWWDFWRTEA